jgi:hypothetical protein
MSARPSHYRDRYRLSVISYERSSAICQWRVNSGQWTLNSELMRSILTAATGIVATLE